MSLTGRIESVYVDWGGSQVTADTASGDTVIPVAFPVDFDENGGTFIRVPENASVTDSNVYTYTAVDVDGETVTLATALTLFNLFSEGDRLLIYPAATETRALVRLSDSYEEPACDCRVVHSLRPLLAEGTRPPGTGESVLVDTVNDEQVVTDLAGAIPVIQGAESQDDGSMALTPGSFTINPDGTQNAASLVLPVDGIPSWTDNANGVWKLGAQTLITSAAQDIGTTSLSAVTDLSIFLPVGTYRVHLYLNGHTSTVSGVTMTPGFLFDGTVSSVNASAIIYVSTGQNSAPIISSSEAVTSLSGFLASPPSDGNPRTAWVEIWGVITVSAAGNLQTAVKSSTSGDNFHASAGCVMEVTPA
jgi:hypothetical protein